MVVAGRVAPHDEWGSAPVHRAGVFGLHGVLAMPAADVRAIATERLNRLRRWYAPVMDVALSSIVCDAAGTALVWTGPPTRPPMISVHGVPLGASGAASDDEVRAALADPASSQLAGVWSIIGLGSSRARVVTSRGPVHTLVEVRGSDSWACGSRGAVAHALAARVPELARDRLGDLVALDYVLGSEELLTSGQLLEEGSVVDIDSGRAQPWQPERLADRYRPRSEVTAKELRAVVGAAAAKAVVPGATLALTAGRDSALLLSCLVERGHQLPTFTMGYRTLPDAQGAAGAARSVGMSHSVLTSNTFDGVALSSARGTERWATKVTSDSDAGRRLFDEVVRWSVWTEGLDHPRNLLMGWLRWPSPSTVAVTGSGGEIGRAFYWHESVPVDPVETICRPWHAILAEPTWESLRSRVAADLADSPVDGDAADVLDLLYVRGRMRKWVNRSAAFRPVAGTCFPFLESDVIRTLLGIPRHQRLDGSVFDAAIGLHRPNMHLTARAAAAPSHVTRLARRPLRRFLPVLPSDWPILEALISHGVERTDLHRRLFRSEWWERALATGGGDPTVRAPLWGYVAAAAMEQALASPG